MDNPLFDPGAIIPMDQFREMGIETRQPTGELRWLGGILQQRFRITKTVGGAVQSISREWIDVPMAAPSLSPEQKP